MKRGYFEETTPEKKTFVQRLLETSIASIVAVQAKHLYGTPNAACRQCPDNSIENYIQSKSLEKSSGKTAQQGTSENSNVMKNPPSINDTS